MKILVCGDVHWSTYSSIVRSRGDKYSKRLDNLIKSVNWVEEQARVRECEKIVYLGDFFDKPELTAEEISALKEIIWSDNIQHTILVGNHELGLHNAKYNSAQLFNLLPNFEVIDSPRLDVTYGAMYLYLPYIFEEDRKNINYYINDALRNCFITQEVKGVYIFSHNDLQISYAGFMNKDGFTVEDVDKSSTLFINGHLHNGSQFSNKGINLGNLTGQNFSENAFDYDHRVIILNINGPEYTKQYLCNPHAFNFYKVDYNDEKDLSHIVQQNAIVSFRCKSSKIQELKELIKNFEIIIEYRITSIPDVSNVNETKIKELTQVDHIRSFKEYIKGKLDNTDILDSELQMLN